jgi:hypothetical protein
MTLMGIAEPMNDVSVRIVVAIFMHSPRYSDIYLNPPVGGMEYRVAGGGYATAWSVRGTFTESWRSLNERPFLRTHHL